MLIQFASHSTRIAIAASPAPRKIALIRKSMTITTFPPSITRAYVAPMVCTAGLAPITASRRGASATPTTPITTATISPSAIPCTAASAAASAFFSPMRRATTAVTPIDSPIAAV
jgi:hypothetical protein